MRPVPLEELNSVDRALVALQSQVGFALRSKVPQLYSFVHRCRCKLGGVFGVESECQHKMLVPLEHVLEGEFGVILPHFNLPFVGAGDDEGLSGVNNDGPDKILVGFKGVFLLHGVVVEHTHMEVV